jgi:L-amino acid N-acyltransferase YncA
MPSDLTIRPLAAGDEPELFAVFAQAVREGGAFPRRAPVDPEVFRTAWLRDAVSVQVGRLDGTLIGGYFLKPNFPGLAGHVANAGYVVSASHRRRGFGRALAEHSLAEARRHGFDAMMFNLVLEHNPSRALWHSLGFRQIGRIPDAVDGQAALMYWRALTPAPRPATPGPRPTGIEIRPAQAPDAPAMAGIFAQAVTAGEGTFETRAPGPESFARAIRDGDMITLVATAERAVVAWARLHPYTPSRAGIGLYQLYVARSYGGEGLGRLVLEDLVSRAEAAGYFKVVGRIFASNQPAIRVAEACGFHHVGIHRRHGQVNGHWQDVVVVERLLGAAARD